MWLPPPARSAGSVSEEDQGRSSRLGSSLFLRSPRLRLRGRREVIGRMPEAHNQDGSVLAAVSNAMVALHKEQFGRGPTVARSNFAGADTLVCILEDALLPAEKAMVQMGEQHRVRETRSFYQVATAQEFTDTLEALIG